VQCTLCRVHSINNLTAENICLKVYIYLPNDPFMDSLQGKLVTSHSHSKPAMCGKSLTVLACILWVQYTECGEDSQFKVAEVWLGSDMLSPSYHIIASPNPTYEA
jgi:hypothetical protein